MVQEQRNEGEITILVAVYMRSLRLFLFKTLGACLVFILWTLEIFDLFDADFNF